MKTNDYLVEIESINFLGDSSYYRDNSKMDILSYLLKDNNFRLLRLRYQDFDIGIWPCGPLRWESDISESYRKPFSFTTPEAFIKHFKHWARNEA